MRRLGIPNTQKLQRRDNTSGAFLSKPFLHTILAMIDTGFPNNLLRLHEKEQSLREEALGIIQGNPRLLLHFNVIERAMTLANIIREYPTEDEDFKVIKMLSIRMFNAFGASLNLMLSGYHQKSAMVMRDVLENLFLMDLFRTDHAAIKRWRFANDRKSKEEFLPVKVREALDKRDGFEGKKRAETYKMLSELAAHPTMGTQYMLRPEKDADILMGPFMGATILREGLDELGNIAQRAGGIMNGFLPREYDLGSARESFLRVQRQWMEAFPKHVRP